MRPIDVEYGRWTQFVIVRSLAIDTNEGATMQLTGIWVIHHLASRFKPLRANDQQTIYGNQPTNQLTKPYLTNAQGQVFHV